MALADSHLGTFLRGARTYVQGTQLLARTAERVPGPGVTLEQVVFSQITDHDAIVFDAGATLPGNADVLGRCRFDTQNGPMDLVWIAAESEAPRKDEDMNIAFSISGELPDDASIAFSQIDSLEDMLNVLVQGLKSHHARHFAGATDIWFTGLRKAALPVVWPSDLNAGEMLVSQFREQDHNGQIQTMCRADIHFASAEPLSAYVNFACKWERP